MEQFVVDIGLKICSCRRWDSTGIPCLHVILSLELEGKDPFDFVDSCYTLDDIEEHISQ